MKENHIGIQESSIPIRRIKKGIITNQVITNEVPKLSFRSPLKSKGREDYEKKKNSKLERWVGVGCRRDPLRRIIGKGQVVL